MLIDVLENGRYMKVGSTKQRLVTLNVVSTSSVSPNEAVAIETMLQEFKDCVCESEVLVPALRDTKDDIIPLARFFIEQFDPKKRKLTKEARQRLECYQWSGNVRELVNVIKTAVAKCHDDEIKPEHLNIPESGTSCNQTLADLEKASIIAAMKRNDGNKSEAAKELGMSRRCLYDKMKKYHLMPADE